MKLKNKNGDVFEFHFNDITRGAWVVELVSVNGNPTFVYSDPWPTEREARAHTRASIDNWYDDERHGWCKRHEEPEASGPAI